MRRDAVAAVGAANDPEMLGVAGRSAATGSAPAEVWATPTSWFPGQVI